MWKLLLLVDFMLLGEIGAFGLLGLKLEAAATTGTQWKDIFEVLRPWTVGFIPTFGRNFQSFFLFCLRALLACDTDGYIIV